MDIEKERAEFELAFPLPDGVYFTGEFYQSSESSSYSGMFHDMRWQAWQARAAKAVPEGWKLVPVEPTSEMVDNAIQAISDGYTCNREGCYVIYNAMLDNAPEPKP